MARANNDDLSPCLFFFYFLPHPSYCAQSNMPVQYEGFATLSTGGRAKLDRCNAPFHRAYPQNPFPSMSESCYAVELLKSTKLIAYGIPVGCPVASLVMVASFHACQVLGDMKVPSKPSVIAHRPVQVFCNHIFFSAIPFSRRQMMP